MDFAPYIRKPFAVEACEITTENIAEVAELIGVLKHKDDGTPFILVNKALIPNVFRVYPGYWLTKMDDNLRCYSRKVFQDQFMPNDEAKGSARPVRSFLPSRINL